MPSPNWTRLDPYGELRATRLLPFTEWSWPLVDPADFHYGRHLGLVCDYLEAVTAGEIRRLLINVPPGHMKSLATCVFWPAWAWVRDPSTTFMFMSYREELALRDADRARELIRHPEFQAAFGDRFKLRKDQNQKSRYTTDRKGYRFSTSVAGIMGEGGKFVVFDDPHNVEQAESEAVRNEKIRRIKLALPTRVRSPAGGIVVIMQRLHEQDLAGHLIADENDLVHLCLPARYESDHPYVTVPRTLPSGRELPGDWRTEEGELLFPELFPEPRLKSLEVTLGSYGTAGQLQQRPAPREGGLFKRSWFEVVDAVPSGKAMRQVRGYDLAATKDDAAARTASVKMARIGDVYYVLHARAIQETPGKVEQELKATASQDGKRVVIDLPQDPGQAGKSQVRYLTTQLAGYVVKHSPESGDKVTRAEAFAAQAEAGNVKVLRGDWNDEYLDELATFPFGRFADYVDASSRAFHRLVAPALRRGKAKGMY